MFTKLNFDAIELTAALW